VVEEPSAGPERSGGPAEGNRTGPDRYDVGVYIHIAEAPYVAVYSLGGGHDPPQSSWPPHLRHQLPNLGLGGCEARSLPTVARRESAAQMAGVAREPRMQRGQDLRALRRQPANLLPLAEPVQVAWPCRTRESLSPAPHGPSTYLDARPDRGCSSGPGQYPRWSKDKLHVVLKREGVLISASMIGRILTYLSTRGVLREPARIRKLRRRSATRPHAKRKPSDWTVSQPGDLLQIDTKDVRPVPGRVFKHLSLVDVTSRHAAAEIGISATAKATKERLDRMLDRLPFPVRALQIDGGSEFKGAFEEFCRDRHIQLFVLPPRSPKLNGCVERLQRTFDEEFYQCSDAEPRVGPLNAALRKYESVYNTVRPHQSLGYRTPQEYLDQNRRVAA
jgi:transposase InsO family protein